MIEEHGNRRRPTAEDGGAPTAVWIARDGRWQVTVLRSQVSGVVDDGAEDVPPSRPATVTGARAAMGGRT